MRSGEWKYLVTAEGEFLFDVEKDPGEASNLKVQRGDVLARLSAKYGEWERTMLTPVPLDPRDS